MHLLRNFRVFLGPEHLTTQFFTCRMPFLPPNQQRQSTEGTWTILKMHDRLIDGCTLVSWAVFAGVRRADSGSSEAAAVR